MMHSAPERPDTDIVMFLPHFGPGGSQRVACILLEAWTRRGLKCVLVTTRNTPGDAHVLAPGIERVVLFPARGSTAPAGRTERWLRAFPALRSVASTLALARRVWRLRQQMRQLQPRVVVSFLSITNIAAILARPGLPIRLVVSERNDPVRQPLVQPMQWFRKATYRFADRVTANTRGALAYMGAFVPPEKLGFVANPLLALPDRAADTLGSRRFIYVGRLVPQKGVDDLLVAFGDSRLDDWALDIVGDGPLKSDLMRKAEEMGITDRVRFLGHRTDVGTLLAAASVFVLPSLYEGMPNVLLEAMAHGLPLIVTDASPGPVDLAADGVGLVVPASASRALAGAMKQLAEDDGLRVAMSAAARRKSAEFSLAQVMATWDGILGLGQDGTPPTP